jgi:hypothetical protein
MRSIRDIAYEIRLNWPRVYFGAVPYLEAMYSLHNIEDSYGYDSAKSVIAYFLSNAATTWKGPVAKRIKAELRDMIK